MKKPPSFGRFLLTMVFLLEGLSLAIVISFLFAMLDRSMKMEHVSRTNVQQAELRLHLTNRLNYTYTRVQEIRSNNNIKIGLLVGMPSRITENLQTLYPPTFGSTFYVRGAAGRYFPQPRDNQSFLNDADLLSNQSGNVIQIAVDPHTFAYFAPIVQQQRIAGYAVGIYDLSADQQCMKLLRAFTDLSLAFKQDAHLTDLPTHRPLPLLASDIFGTLPSAQYPQVLSGSVVSRQDDHLKGPSTDRPLTAGLPRAQYRLASDGAKVMFIGMDEFPYLFLILGNQQYRQRRWSLVTKLVFLCMPLFLLTFTFSFLILKRVTCVLDAMAKNALYIADTGAYSNLDTAKVRHAEFLYLTKAFNKLLSKVRQQTDDLKLANENLQNQIEVRRQMAQALEESESQLRSLQDNIPVGLFRRSIEGRILFVNPKLLSIFGYDSEADMMQVPTRSLYYYPQQYDHVMGKLETSGSIQGLELRFKRKDGTPVWGAVHLKKTEDPVSGTVNIDGAFLDITDRKKIEDENHKLEGRLRQSHKMEALGTLAGGIAHDFNNILFAIIGFCELAIEDAVPETVQQKNLQGAIACVHRASELVRQILTFARQTDVQKHPLNLTPILRESIKLLRATLPATIDIRTEFNGDQAVLADPTQMHQIIVNLCTNAGHAMRETGGVLTIGFEKIDVVPDQAGFGAGLKQGAFARLRVSDTGQGMPAETIERIFDPYFTTKPHGEGTGMGLSVVQGIVRSMEGVICVDSLPGKGTTFDIYLPALEKMELMKHRPLEPVVSGREHILVVDDERIITRIISEILSKLGYQVTPRNSPTEALELFRHDPEQFDLVISDVTMPQMAGHDLAREMMKIRPDLPVVLCTGYSESISEETALDIGVRALLYKPLSRHDLSTAIRGVLDCRQVA